MSIAKQVMQAAWKHYRDVYGRWSSRFDTNGFRFCLKDAWRKAKEAKALAAIPAPVKAAQIEVIRDQLDALSFKPAHVNIIPLCRALEAELSRLAR